MTFKITDDKKPLVRDILLDLFGTESAIVVGDLDSLDIYELELQIEETFGVELNDEIFESADFKHMTLDAFYLHIENSVME